MLKGFLLYLLITNANPIAKNDRLILEQRLSYNNHRFSTFAHALYLMHKRNAKIIVETGTARHGEKNCEGDGCSTIIFGNWAKNNKSILYSVDINQDYLRNAAQSLGEAREAVEFIHNDSISFLRDFPETIDFLYLDSYDYEIHNPNPSQEHHLNEIIAAYPHLSENSVVMIDDCDLPNGGKGKLVIEYLLDRGWVVSQNNYQVILVKK